MNFNKLLHKTFTDDINFRQDGDSVLNVPLTLDEYDTIRSALRIVIALQGEPSEGMVEAGILTLVREPDSTAMNVDVTFKAMAAQLILETKEIDDDR